MRDNTPPDTTAMFEFLFLFLFMLPLALAVMMHFIVTNSKYTDSLPLTKKGHEQFYPRWPLDGWGTPCVFFVWIFFLATLAAVGYLWFILLCLDLYGHHKKQRDAKSLRLEKTSPGNPFPQPSVPTSPPGASTYALVPPTPPNASPFEAVAPPPHRPSSPPAAPAATEPLARIVLHPSAAGEESSPPADTSDTR